jgi:hypothetical protein
MIDPDYRDRKTERRLLSQPVLDIGKNWLHKRDGRDRKVEREIIDEPYISDYAEPRRG